MEAPEPQAETRTTAASPQLKPRTTAASPQLEPLYPGLVGVALVGGSYAILNTWTYFAWYRKRAGTEHIVFRDEGLFGPDTYAGGSDKLGHFWVNYIMTRLTANTLEAGGWGVLPSTVVGFGLSQAYFTMIELKDGYHKGYGFSWWDMGFNAAGSLLGGALALCPVLDDWFDFKVYYLPTRAYLRSLIEHGVVNAGEDYSGQTFTLAYHLVSIESLKHDPVLRWLRYLDVTLNYRSKNYLPKPERPNTDRYQELSLGAAFNFQHLIDVLFDRDTRPRGHGQGSLRFANEAFGMPYTNPALLTLRRNNGPAPSEQEE